MTAELKKIDELEKLVATLYEEVKKLSEEGSDLRSETLQHIKMYNEHIKDLHING